ncbi:MAG: hypothetical protein V3S89_10015 [Desulfobacterales bacterium]
MSDITDRESGGGIVIPEAITGGVLHRMPFNRVEISAHHTGIRENSIKQRRPDMIPEPL